MSSTANLKEGDLVWIGVNLHKSALRGFVDEIEL